MAVGTPAVLKDNGAITTSGQTTVAVTSVVVASGGVLVTVHVACSNGTTAVGDPSGVSDGTNSFTKRDSATRSTTVYESVWDFYYASGGTKTITVTLGAASNYTHVVVTGTSGTTTTPFDKADTGSQGGTTAVSIPTSGALAQTDEASLVSIMWSTATAMSVWPPNSSSGGTYTSLVNTTNATRTRGRAVAYKTALSAAIQTATATLGATASWAGVIATYKGAGGTTFTDSGTGTITLTGSGAESESHTASGSGTISLTGSKTESQSHVGSGTGSFALTGSGSESQTHSRSGSAALALTGTSSESFNPGGTSTSPSDEPIAVRITVHS